MRYLALALLLLTGCASKSAVPVTFVCVNPAMSIQGIQIPSSDPNIEIKRDVLVIHTPDGATVTMPRSLCMTIAGGTQ